jgi:hypothetical protein
LLFLVSLNESADSLNSVKLTFQLAIFKFSIVTPVGTPSDPAVAVVVGSPFTHSIKLL